MGSIGSTGDSNSCSSSDYPPPSISPCSSSTSSYSPSLISSTSASSTSPSSTLYSSSYSSSYSSVSSSISSIYSSASSPSSSSMNSPASLSSSKSSPDAYCLPSSSIGAGLATSSMAGGIGIVKAGTVDSSASGSSGAAGSLTYSMAEREGDRGTIQTRAPTGKYPINWILGSSIKGGCSGGAVR